MIPRTIEWIRKMNEEHSINPARVLDVGSFDSNGSPRQLFPDSEYIGIDIRDGRSVDKIIDAHIMADYFEYQSFDAVMCLNLLEHVRNPLQVVSNINYVLADYGHLYVSVPTIGFPQHNAPSDYWRMTEAAVREIVMWGYDIISLEHGVSQFGKYPIIDCLGAKNR